MYMYIYKTGSRTSTSHWLLGSVNVDPVNKLSDSSVHSRKIGSGASYTYKNIG